MNRNCKYLPLPKLKRMATIHDEKKKAEEKDARYF